MNVSKDPEMTWAMSRIMQELKKDNIISQEIWKDVPGYEGLYQVSNCGRVKSFCRGTEYILNRNVENNYVGVGLSKNGKIFHTHIHRLVAKAFIPIPKDLLDAGYDESTLQINHKDENKSNNHVSNLEWCTPKYNTEYSQAREVSQFDMQGNWLSNWVSIAEAARNTNTQNSSIGSCCIGEQAYANNYIWRYALPEYSEGYKLDVSKLNMTGKPVKSISQFDTDGNWIKNWVSARDVSEHLNINFADISTCCNGGVYTAGGYIWRFTQPEYGPGYVLDFGDNYRGTRVSQFDLNGRWIRNWNNGTEAARFLNLVRVDSITKCCRKLPNYNHVLNYVFRYYKPEYGPGYVLPADDFKSELKEKSISQFTMEGDYIRDYSSCAEAAGSLNINKGTLNDVVRGQRSQCGGYIWRKKQDYFVKGYNLFKIDMEEMLNKPVLKIDRKTNEVLATFENALAAFNSFRKGQSKDDGWRNIHQCCEGIIEHCYGYIWRYAE